MDQDKIKELQDEVRNMGEVVGAHFGFDDGVVKGEVLTSKVINEEVLVNIITRLIPEHT